MAIRLLTALLTAVVVVLIGPLGAIATAHADTNSNSNNTFLTALKSEGITDHVSTQDAIQAGHSVCQKLDGGETPTAVANDVLNNSQMPAYHCGYFVGASIRAYCPQYTSKLSNK
jgi:hypothetical protein